MLWWSRVTLTWRPTRSSRYRTRRVRWRGEQPVEGPDQQSGSGQQDDGQRDLGGQPFMGSLGNGASFEVSGIRTERSGRSNPAVRGRIAVTERRDGFPLVAIVRHAAVEHPEVGETCRFPARLVFFRHTCGVRGRAPLENVPPSKG